MPSSVDHEHALVVGTPAVIESLSHVRPHGVLVEDDGDTGYLYAVAALDDGGIRILDAVPLYAVGRTADRGAMCAARLSWSADGMKALLALDAVAYAVFDFSTRTGRSRLQQTWDDRLAIEFE